MSVRLYDVDHRNLPDGVFGRHDGAEALFFTGVDECVDKIRSLIEERVDRSEIARRGALRAFSSGYDNLSRLRRLVASTPPLAERLGGLG